MASILVIDADRGASEAVVSALSGVGFRVREAASCRIAQQLIAEEWPDLVLVDRQPPDMSALEFAERVRQGRRDRALRIMLAASRGALPDAARALESGAVDDYLLKPYQSHELLARTRALLRRPIGLPTDEIVTLGPIVMDRVAHRVTVADEEVVLAPTEYRLLEYLLTHPGRVHSRTHLLQHVWGRENGVSPRTVDVHVRRLRQLLERHSLEGLIQTIRGFGYRMQAEPVPPA